jgi:hypothetical protein
MFPAKSLRLFVPAKTIPGQRRSYSSGSLLMAFATFRGGREALLGFSDAPTPHSFIALQNTTPGHIGLPSVNADGIFAMRAGLTLGSVVRKPTSGKLVTRSNDQAILVGSSPGDLRIIAQEGSPVSSTIPDVFSTFQEPAFNDQAATAFFALVTGPRIPVNQASVLIYHPSGQESKILARTGTPAAELTGGELWKSFTAMVLPDTAGGPIFLAQLSGSHVNATNSIGLWATDSAGKVRLLLRTGEILSINGADKTVSLINSLGAAADSAGQGRYLDLEGNISATLTFTDGTTALVQFGMPNVKF